MNENRKFARYHNLAIVCFSSSFGGLEITTVQLARELASRGASCMLVVPEHTPLAEQAEKYGLPVEYIKPGLRYGDLLASGRLARILKAHKTEIVVVMQSHDLNVVAAAKLVVPAIKIVFYQQMQSGISKTDFLHTWMYRKLSLWIALTSMMKDDVLKTTRMPARLVTVVSLGRDTSEFDPTHFKQLEARKRFGLPPERQIVGMLGRLDPLKGQEEFLRTLPSVRAQHPDVLYVIAGEETRGESGYGQYLSGLANDLGIREHVTFLPFTDSVPEFLAALDIFVMPSYGETYGLVLIEAMAMEKPVIATRAGGVPDLVENGVDGLLIPPRDEKGLADALLRVLGDPGLRLALAQRARRTVLERFEISRCIDQLVGALDSL